MSTPAAAPAADTDGEAAAPKQGGKKKLLILLAVPLVLLGVVAGLWFTGILPPLLGMGEKTAKVEHPADLPVETVATKAPIFVEVPEMIANLNNSGKRQSFVKLKARIEVGKEADQAVVTAAMPRVLDLFQTYLREIRPEELRGSAGTWRLREELIARANIAVAPARVTDVLFTEMLIQ
jgi:flagellar FliL protein